MTKLLLNYILIYAIITIITVILILWHGKKERDVILIIAGSSAIAILLFYLFYITAMNTAKLTQPTPLSEAMVGSTSETTHREVPTKSEVLIDEPKGPFPVDDTMLAKERQIGRLFNIWHKAVLTKNISQINQLDSQIKGCGDEAIPFLTRLAREDANERVRAFAVRVLGRMDIAELNSALPSVNSAETALANSAETPESIRGTPSTYWSAGQLSALFTELLRDDASAFVRENSAWALGRLGDAKTLEILQKVADSDASAQVRKVASEAIENIKSSRK